MIYFYNDGLGIPGTGPFTYPGEWELYDMQLDPDELNNVFHDPAYLSVREALQVKLWLAQAAVGDVPHSGQERLVVKKVVEEAALWVKGMGLIELECLVDMGT